MNEVVGIKSVSHRHEAIVDLMLLHPEKPKAWIAEQLGFTAPWLSTVTGSKAFQEYYHSRREAANKEKLDEIYAKQLKVAAKAYDRMEEYLDSGEVDPQLAFNIGNQTANAVGLGPKRVSVTTEQTREIATIPVDREALALARERLKQTITHEG